jgi:predicted permease
MLRERLSEFRQDAAFAARQLAAHPGFTLVAVLTLALGIGATTAIFSVVDAVVLRPLPVPRPERLVAITTSAASTSHSDLSVGNYLALAERAEVFSGIAAMQFSSFNLSAGETPARVAGVRATHSFFAVFGVAPALGRAFGAEEDQPGREQVVVLSNHLWRRSFGGDREVVGRDVRMNGLPYRVIGVMPARFDLMVPPGDLWVPVAFTPERKAKNDEHYLRVVGRLRDGVSRARAAAALKPIAAELQRTDAQNNQGMSFDVESVVEQTVGGYRSRLYVLLGAVGLVLLIACGNVASLLLARGAARSRELAIRAALGAGRGRIVRQLLTEHAVLALAGGVVGVALAAWGIKVIVAAAPPGVPRLDQSRVDATLLVFAFGLSILSSLLFGLAPALRATRAPETASLKEGGRGAAGAGRDRLRSALIAAEVALAVLLLVGAGLLIRSALALQRVDLGFQPAGLITGRISFPEAGYQEPARIAAALDRIAQGAAQGPGVRSVELSTLVPMAEGGTANGLLPEGKPFSMDSLVLAQLCIVTPGYFQTLGIPIVRGRALTAGDRRGVQKVMVINQTAAAALFPGLDPVGRRAGCCEAGAGGGPDLKLIVGVAKDLRLHGPAEKEIPAAFYLPLAQAPDDAWTWLQRTVFLVARAQGEPAALVPGLRRAVAAVDPHVPLYDVETMEARMGSTLATEHFNALLLGLLGAIGLLLSAAGIYGVVSFFVSQRTAEIGMRMALGATPSDVTRLVMRQAVVPVAAGVAAGLIASAVATRLLTAFLFGVQRGDPLTLAGVVAALVATALLASFVPARRATRVDPASVLQG